LFNNSIAIFEQEHIINARIASASPHCHDQIIVIISRLRMLFTLQLPARSSSSNNRRGYS